MQGYLLDHPKISIICKQVRPSHRPGLFFQSYGISMAQLNNRITGRVPWEDPGVIVQQEPEAVKQTHCNER